MTLLAPERWRFFVANTSVRSRRPGCVMAGRLTAKQQALK